ncbi:MAG: hypothetical protein GF317_10790 [Candidatus Lokiarchaeota archaeon]|nr:hypothetical protein [Candidatus Lokiarchaeota archaeon]MBD3200148.1 hypothetical protein [Candidatus Lokiarchaeota archaeon]
MMQESEFKDLYQIEEDRLYSYYERIKKQSKQKSETEIVARFLNNQSIGPPISEMIDILNYYEEKIIENKTILDFAFEMIRANKIRLEYKKYISTEQFTNLELAIDDCIFLFFLEYDDFIRRLLKPEVKEFEVSALYEIFLNPYENKSPNLFDILEKHKVKVPTIYEDHEKINTNIITLRSGLSNIIRKDYEKVKTPDKKLGKQPMENYELTVKKKEETSVFSFQGFLIERMLKSHCISKNNIASREVENAVSQFLSSYLKFGTIYELKEFIDILKRNLSEEIYSGLTETVRESYSLKYIQKLISIVLEDFVSVNINKKLDGSAWKDDLKPILNKFLTDFINNIFE